MQLKTYQQNVLEQLDRWLDALKEARPKGEKWLNLSDGDETDMGILEDLKNYPRIAWKNLKKQEALPGISTDGKTKIPAYISRTAASGRPIPHVCLKVPTGGGKTLLGVAALARTMPDTGFVLWIVPTTAIYKQTLLTFRTREHPYRQMLERISGGKVKLLEKNEHFTKQDVDSYLCVMMLMLPSANRQKNKEFLKIFRDSGGYTSFFPEQDDAPANQKLSNRYPDLEKSNDNDWVKQSLFNVLKLIRPTVILDEAHKAYGNKQSANDEFVKSVNRLNPRFVLELSATPKSGISNILVNISGKELRDEEMIKMPIDIYSFGDSDWQRTLAETQNKLHELEKAAVQLRSKENRYIRPIALVRVQRTGKAQRDQGNIHAEDARQYLIQNLAVPESHIRIQSSEQKQLAGENLLSEASAVRWIITKDALKEGWDCSFAYLLALLDNTTASTAITQMVGRVMRQPQARNIAASDALNRCAIYCYNTNVEDAVAKVKSGLEKEGLSGLGDCIHGHNDGEAPQPTVVKRRREYKKLKIFLPRVLHKDGNKWRPLDYDRDILGALNWDKLNGGGAAVLGDHDAPQEIHTTVDIEGQGKVSEQQLSTGERLTLDYFVRRVDDLVPNPWQAARVAGRFIERQNDKGNDDVTLLHNRIHLSEILRGRLKRNIDTAAETVFRDKVKNNQIRFHLEANKRLDYELENSLKVFIADETTLKGGRLQRSLFEPIYQSGFNSLEKDFALYLESSDAIYWWHRIAAKQEYYLQGWRRHRVYPDFIACRQGNETLLILETKGMHLKGNEDTKYKKELLETLEKTYKTALDRGTMEVKEPHLAIFRMMFEDQWEEDIKPLLGAS